MRITRIVALAIIAGMLGSQMAQAQTLRKPSAPKEFPPASYKGKQYVDSRGCIYIRAGFDGSVTWVPQVTRSRKQLCGYKPTVVEGSTTSRPQSSPAPVMITLPEVPQPDPKTTASSQGDKTQPTRPQSEMPQTEKPQSARGQTAAPTVVTATKPRRTPQAPPAKTQQVIKPAPKKVLKPAPLAPPAAAAPTAQDCIGGSALSQQYMNQGPNVRCGPQPEAPVTYGRGGGLDQNSSLLLNPNSRILPAHLYQQRQQSARIEVPKGYRPVWTDDRLNPRRAERTPAAADPQAPARVPDGYVQVTRADGRLNPMRGQGSAGGDAQMARVWTNTVPRTLVQTPLDRPTVRLSDSQAPSAAPLSLRLSTRSDPEAESRALAGTKTGAKPNMRYVRAATFETAQAAQSAAQDLARRTGLPVRLGTLTRKGAVYKVVLAGPFAGADAGEAALGAVRGAGYPKARLSR